MKRFYKISLVILIVCLSTLLSLSRKTIKSTPEQPGVTTSSIVSQNDTPAYIPDGWLATSTIGYTYDYPKNLDTSYIHETDWPPKLAATSSPFVCISDNPPTLQTGQTKKVTIGNTDYCVTKDSEGAAGSTYTNYTYMFLKDSKTFTLTFGTREIQCMNYDNPKQQECLDERKNFDIDKLVDEIVETIRY